MPRDILSEFGPDHHSSSVGVGSSGLASGGGKPTQKDVRNYKPPQGPTSIGNKGVGLGGDNHDCGSQGKH
jgi:hypothetical protein